MKNITICPNCSAENPFYYYTCKKCNSFLRSKVANIDFWDIVWNILVTPIKTAETIIFSEHKNYLAALIPFIAFKFSTVNYILKNSLSSVEVEYSFSRSILIGGLFTTALIFLFAFLITQANKLIKVESKLLDNYSILNYSFVPIFVSSIVLWPVQLALYGFYWFTFNPSPIVIKPVITYILYFIELLFIAWTFFLFITSIYTQTRKILYSVLIGIVLASLIIIIQFL